MSVIFSPTDVVNLGLVFIGKKNLIGSIWEGSDEAKAALAIYGQERDALLRTMDFDFSKRDISATLLKYAPAEGYFPPNQWNPANHPPPGWLYEYAYPDDCIKVRSIIPSPLFALDYDPQPNIFAIQNDNAFTPPKRVILCNVQGAILVYTGRVTDPTTWDQDFIEALADKLGERLAPSLSNADAAKMAAAEGQVEAQAAANTQG